MIRGVSDQTQLGTASKTGIPVHECETTLNSHIIAKAFAGKLTPAVVEFRSAAVGVTGYPLNGFKSAVIFKKVRDAGRSKCVR
jgi:hypothetical protein